MFETWVASQNPCNLEIVTALGTVNSFGQFSDTYFANNIDAKCAYEGEQSYQLSTANYLTIKRELWRFDTSGVHRR